MTSEERIAMLAVQGTVPSALVTVSYLRTQMSDLGVSECFTALDASIARVQVADLSEPKGLLMGQAVALQGIFTRMAQAAIANLEKGNLDAHERLLRLALNAQSQSCATLETLGGLVNPPHSAVCAKQANIAHGPQQVNNGVSPAAVASRARAKPVVAPTELLEPHGESKRLDPESTSTSGAAHSTVEAMDGINRPTDS